MPPIALSSPVTFGVEIELVLEKQYSNGSWPAISIQSTDNQLPHIVKPLYEEIRTVLRNAGVSVNTPTEMSASASNIGSVNENSRWSKWSVEGDASIEPTRWGVTPRQRFGIEIVSPKLTLTTKNLAMIGRVLTALQGRYNLYTSLTTTLHVHLGLQGGSLPLELAKRFALVVTRHERLMDCNLLNQHVIRDRESKSFCQSIAGSPNQAQQIRATTSFRQLVNLINPIQEDSEAEDYDRRFYNYNFSGLDTTLNIEGKTRKPTIESRGHPPSISAQEIGNWIMVNYHILQFCAQASDQNFAAFVSSNNSPDIQGFLQMVGCPNSVVTFYQGPGPLPQNLQPFDREPRHQW